MEPITPKRTHNPEAVIQRQIIEFLKQRGWNVMPTHGNAAQKGFPDLYCTHPDYGQRWVEVKYDNYYSFTPAQLEFFPKINMAGIGIWIMTQATKHQYAKLFLKEWFPTGNWIYYYRAKAMMGGAVHRNQVKQQKVKCVCGQSWDLRPHEKINCFCGRIVRV